MAKDRQEVLFEYRNPLLERLGVEFFRALPKSPGVYFFKGTNGDILYIGKAKCLRSRLSSYKNARPGIISRKVLRMLRMAYAIEFRTCASEVEALLTENRLLRKHQPPFNVVNVDPSSYYFIVARVQHRLDGDLLRVRFQLTTDPEVALGGALAGDYRFGVFKGRGSTRRAFGALLRLLSALQAAQPGFYYPAPLTRHRPPYDYSINVPRGLMGGVRQFLHGSNKAFLTRLTERLLENGNIPRFIHHVITQDLLELNEFYSLGPRRVRRLKRKYGIRGRVLRQDEIDDLIVRSSY